MRGTVLLMAVILMMTAGCSTQKPATAKKMTARERNEILAGEPLPGAKVVGRALEVTDQAKARSDRLNAQVDSLPR